MPPLVVRTAWLGCYTYSFPANLRIDHPEPIFKPRPYPRSIVEVFKGGHAFGHHPTMGIIPGELPTAWLDSPCILVGFFVDNPLTEMNSFQTIEILAVIPGKEITPESIQRAVLAPSVPETKAWLDAIR